MRMKGGEGMEKQKWMLFDPYLLWSSEYGEAMFRGIRSYLWLLQLPTRPVSRD